MLLWQCESAKSQHVRMKRQCHLFALNMLVFYWCPAKTNMTIHQTYILSAFHLADLHHFTMTTWKDAMSHVFSNHTAPKQYQSVKIGCTFQWLNKDGWPLYSAIIIHVMIIIKILVSLLFPQILTNAWIQLFTTAVRSVQTLLDHIGAVAIPDFCRMVQPVVVSAWAPRWFFTHTHMHNYKLWL